MTEYKALYQNGEEELKRLEQDLRHQKQDKDILYAKIDKLHEAMRQIIRISHNGQVITIAAKAIEDTACYTSSSQYSLPL